MGVRDRETVRVRSRRGEIQLPVQITPRIEPGHVFTAFHFPEVRTNLLIGQSADVNTSCPEYKVVAVAIDRVGDHAPAPSAAEPAVVA
jgi:formate dehydrogenase major subunit